MRNLINKKTGFSMIEMMVVTFIIFVLAAVVLVNYRSGQKQLALQRAASKLAQDIRMMEEKAMAAGQSSTACSQKPDYKYGFGVHFEKNSQTYTLFADCNGNDKYQPSDEDLIMDSPDMNVVKISRVYGPDGSLPDKFSKADIVFTPPDPTVSSKLLSPGEEDKYQVFIEISLKDDATKTKTIRVNRVGLIEIQ